MSWLGGTGCHSLNHFSNSNLWPMRAEFWQNVSHWQSSQLFLHEQSVHGTCGKMPIKPASGNTHVLQHLTTDGSLLEFAHQFYPFHIRVWYASVGEIHAYFWVHRNYYARSFREVHVRSGIVCPQAIASFSKIFHCQHLIYRICSQQRASTSFITLSTSLFLSPQTRKKQRYNGDIMGR